MSITSALPYWPVNKDGTTYFPEYHRLVLTTTHSKIVDVFIAKGTKESPHTHQPPSVMFVDYDSPLTVREVYEDATETVVFKKETAKRETLLVDHMPPEPFHYVENNDLQNDYFAVRVENPLGKHMPFAQGQGITNEAPEGSVYALWKVTVAENQTISLTTIDFEGCLVAGKKSALKVYQYLFEESTSVHPLQLRGENRLSIWHLPSNQSFKVENNKNEADTLYFLPV